MQKKLDAVMWFVLRVSGIFQGLPKQDRIAEKDILEGEFRENLGISYLTPNPEPLSEPGSPGDLPDQSGLLLRNFN